MTYLTLSLSMRIIFIVSYIFDGYKLFSISKWSLKNLSSPKSFQSAQLTQQQFKTAKPIELN